MRLPSVARFLCVAASLAAAARAQTLEVGAGDAIRIEVAHVDAQVEEGIARVEVDETFRNATARALEGVYRFRLPEDAVVGGFSMWMDGREKRGRVVDATEARATYDAIVRKQRDPGLLEQTGWREFKVSVFPIPASGTVRVKLVYAHPLRDDLGLATLEIPLPSKCGAIGDLRVHVQAREERGLALVDSPSHPKTTFARAERGFDASWSGDGIAPDGPFVVRTLAKQAGFDVALLADRPEGAADGWFLARISPRLAAPPPIPRDVVFVVDRSGSMADRKLEQARAALLAGLATLKPGDRFEIVSFATDVTALGAAGLLEANAENLARARRAANDLVATGGTNLHGALEAALARAVRDPDRLTAIVLLTDGDPTVGLTDPAKILAAWRESGTTARLFAFGVGDDVKDFLLTKLATEGRGAARYVREEENLELPLAALFDRVKAPLLLDPELEVDGEGVEVVDREPRRLPDLFQGHALLVAGRYRGAGRTVVHLRGRAGGKTVAVDVPIEFPAATPARPHVAQLWAKLRVGRLLDDLRIQGPNAELSDEIRKLGLAHQLVTPYTSFLVVEDDPKLAGRASPPGVTPADDGTTFERSPVRAPSAVTLDPTADPGVYSPDPESLSQLPSGSVGAASGSRLGNGVSAFSGRSIRGSGSDHRARASEATTDDLHRSLEWLARHQAPDGSLDFARFVDRCPDVPCDGTGAANHASEATGLAVLAVLGARPCGGRFDALVDRGLRYLSDRCDESGALAPADAPDRLRQHAVAALALAEASALAPKSGRDGELVRFARRALAFALAQRDADGVWSDADGALDLETTAWMVELLLSARSANLDVDPEALARISHALESRATKAGSVRPSAAAAEAIGLLIRLRTGASRDDPDVAARVDRVVTSARAAARGAVSPDVLFWMFGSLALRQVGGPRLKAFAAALCDSTDGVQHLEDDVPDLMGSWPPSGPDRAALGRAGATAMNALTAEVDLEYLQSFGVRKR